MESLAKLFKQYWMISASFLLLAVVYLWHSLTSVPSKASLDKYNVSSDQLHILALTIAVPYIIIWVVGLIGYLRLKSYTESLGDSKDGRGFQTLSRGVLLFTLWLPVSSLAAGLATRYYLNHPTSTEELTWAVNYINILVLFPAFYLLNRGAEQLVRTTKAKTLGMSKGHIIMFIFVVAIYVFLTFHDAARNVALSSNSAAAYYQPDWVILLTIILPRIFMWFLGLSAAANIMLYKNEVKGTIYKLALRYVALGVAGVVIATIVLRIVQSISSVLNGLNLGVLLIVVYILLFVIATGYVLIAKGTKQLQKIEES